MSEILKPCPFCGSEARMASNATGFLQWVYCPECGGQTGYFTGNADGIKKLAIDAWNTRAERTCKQRRLFNLVSRECDGEYYQWHDEEMPNFCPNCGAKVVK